MKLTTRGKIGVTAIIIALAAVLWLTWEVSR